MEYAKLAADIIEKVGGKENVTNLATAPPGCASA